MVADSIGRTTECRRLSYRERETVYESTSETHVRPGELLSRDIHIWSNTDKWETFSNYFINSLKKLAHFTIHTTRVMKMARLAYLCASEDERSN